jgi:hypothetical protein
MLPTLTGGYRSSVGFNVLSDGLSLAGFQVIMYGRFRVITEVETDQLLLEGRRDVYLPRRKLAIPVSCSGFH